MISIALDHKFYQNCEVPSNFHPRGGNFVRNIPKRVELLNEKFSRPRLAGFGFAGIDTQAS